MEAEIAVLFFIIMVNYKRNNNVGREKWSSLLLEAAESYNEHWLAYQIEAHGMMRGAEIASENPV